MPNDEELSDIEKSWPIETSQNIMKIMQAVLNHELKVTAIRHQRPIQTSTHAKIHIPPDDDRAAIFRIGEDGMDPNKTEHFWTIGLNEHFEICFLDLIATGNEITVTFPIVKAFRGFIYYAATQAIFVHNHVTQEPPQFSEPDKKTTVRLIRAGHILGIDVFDHIVINSNLEPISMLNEDLIENLKGRAAFAELEIEKVAKVVEKLTEESDLKDEMINLKDKILARKEEEITRLKEELAKAKNN
ncbi:MAG: hypothetical protein FWE37_00755 [Spirochaetaceae bacterium]|nr:hypothetical protein [Spirochaetaceae bacterium]